MYSETTGVQVPDIFIKGDKIFFKNLLSSTNSFTLLWRSSATLDILWFFYDIISFLIYQYLEWLTRRWTHSSLKKSGVSVFMIASINRNDNDSITVNNLNYKK